MRLRNYFQRIHEMRDQLGEGASIVISKETADGGVAGTAVEVTPALAARMMIEGRARLATEEEAAEYQRAKMEAYRAAAEKDLANRIQVTVVNAENLRQAKKSGIREDDRQKG